MARNKRRPFDQRKPLNNALALAFVGELVQFLNAALAADPLRMRLLFELDAFRGMDGMLELLNVFCAGARAEPGRIEILFEDGTDKVLGFRWSEACQADMDQLVIEQVERANKHLRPSYPAQDDHG